MCPESQVDILPYPRYDQHVIQVLAAGEVDNGDGQGIAVLERVLELMMEGFAVMT